MAVAIFNNGIIQVNSLHTNSFMSQGKNVANGWSNTGKFNFSVGLINGNLNRVPVGANIINDPDISDGPLSNSIGEFGPTGGSNLEGF